MSAWIKAALVAAVLAAVSSASWAARGWKADADFAAYLQEQTRASGELKKEVAELDTVNENSSVKSTARVDAVAAENKVEVRYVTKQVIQYRDRPDAGKCVLPAEWVRLYNRSGGGGVPQAVQARSAVDGSPDRVRTAAGG